MPAAPHPEPEPRSERYVCVHGHFYQPPRENPWLEAVEVQNSAYPYHDWNERITAECYAPNSASRLISGAGKIRGITNNYGHMSFDFGPTLLSWLESAAPRVYEAVIEADGISRETFAGHGSALAQAYNHLILPLATSRDKYTQILWGIRDFEHRFGRPPEGMWIPETAVDLESLRMMAELGLKFTVLSPHQAGRVRLLGESDAGWGDVGGSRIDPTRAYQCDVGEGRALALFFYDGPISQAIGFEQLLARGEDFEARLMGAFSDERDWAQLVHIATDGETYGHHFSKGDMALAYALELAAAGGRANLVNYGAYLELHPPSLQVEIIENTSWSCPHGVERWRSDCGCNTGMHPGWNQGWRAPLRQAMDWLRDVVVPPYEAAVAEYVGDPWGARNEYIDIILDRSPERLEAYLAKQAHRPLDEAERTRLLQLLELQRHALLMFTSCGWFFDEVSGLETVQVIQYAGRVLQLARDSLGMDLEAEFVNRLEAAKSNIPEHRDGRVVYDKFVRPTSIDLEKVAAHHAISSLFEGNRESNRIYAFEVERTQTERVEAGATRFEFGRAKVRSTITLEQKDFDFAVLHFGDHNLACKLSLVDEGAHAQAAEEAKKAFSSADLAATLRILDQGYGETTYSLRSLFRDQQRKVLGLITDAALSETVAMYRTIYERHTPLLFFISSLGVPPPPAFKSAAGFVLNADLDRALRDDQTNVEWVDSMLQVVTQSGVALDGPGLGLTFQHTLDRLADLLVEAPDERERLLRLIGSVGLVSKLPFDVDLWGPQNRYYELLTTHLPMVSRKALRGDEEAQSWRDDFVRLGDMLGVEVQEA